MSRGACPEQQEEQKEEELVVGEADAVVDPGTVMIHLQDAALADSAMVAAVWFVLAAPLAVSSFA
eukprot:CAMPEP_0195026460 /NCGR_PEP_ID=MMETSP0326_2-20130528/50320_1 /TAXON_ID=2866 ORGANISM="Crypthecodinium cohnii, Strain Seligo" /NCGR_SAMPLE_ID=MMETSP0326_2 /ASSEMBLY_ACC=CAM_ASM_000348 /LENGTH=64 /DNA_ID=CAMNT_0040048315 /DNA_START=684 /DNA_END=876 /DNA_ORIENTATION=-